MWALVCLLAVHAFASDANADLFSADAGKEDLGSDHQNNDIDQELARMSSELDEQPVQQAVKDNQDNAIDQELAQPENVQPIKVHPRKEEQISDSPNIDVKRYVELEPDEELALVQYNVPAQIISTRPGDKIAIVPVGGRHTTPCPTTTSKNPHPHMYCQSCGRKNPKEKGLITSYIDVSSSRECASLCARYLAKGNRCDVWEYHGEWRNKQCFLLYIPSFKKCVGDIGALGETNFESGTCDNEGGLSSGIDEDLETESMDLSDGLPSWFPRVESSVGSILENHPTTWTLSLAAVFMMIVGAVFYQRAKRPAVGYTQLLDNREEV